MQHNYRGWLIQESNPQDGSEPEPEFAWWFSHEFIDDEDDEDALSGFATSVEDAKKQIDEICDD